MAKTTNPTVDPHTSKIDRIRKPTDRRKILNITITRPTETVEE